MKVVFAEVGGLRTRYLVAGSGPLVVLVHPVGYTADVFVRLIPVLSSAFTVVAPDLPGQGFSEPKVAPTVPPQRYMADQMLALAAQLGFQRFSILGSSLGGLVAALVALDAPARVEKLILVGTGSVFNDPADQPRVLQAVYANGSTAYLDPSPDACRTRINNTCHVRPDAEDLLLLQATAYALPGALDAYRNIIDGMVASAADAAHTAHPHLERLQMPVLVLLGANDKRTSVDAHRAGTARIPVASMAVIDDCGHLPYLEHPAQFARILTGFLGPGEVAVN